MQATGKDANCLQFQTQLLQISAFDLGIKTIEQFICDLPFILSGHLTHNGMVMVNFYKFLPLSYLVVIYLLGLPLPRAIAAPMQSTPAMTQSIPPRLHTSPNLAEQIADIEIFIPPTTPIQIPMPNAPRPQRPSPPPQQSQRPSLGEIMMRVQPAPLPVFVGQGE